MTSTSNDVSTWPAVPEHVVVPASERQDFEQRFQMTWCRRCGSPVVNDRFPENITKRPCQVVRIGLR